MNRPTEENKVSWKDLSEDCKAEVFTLYPDVPVECYINCDLYYRDNGWWLTASDITHYYFPLIQRKRAAGHVGIRRKLDGL